jgi:hypothetical protein
LPQDPGTLFGGLFAKCIRDEYIKEDRRVLVEGFLFLIFGACSSILTTYFLSLAGIFV